MHKRNLHSAQQSHRPRSSSSRRDGFTLLELLLVLSILVVVGGIVMVNLGTAGNDAKVDATTMQLNNIKQAISVFQIRMNALPQSLDELMNGPSDASKKAKWTGPILPEIPNDAWDNAIVYSPNGNTYELRSAGIDGQTNTDDDILVTAP